jgi:2-methylcitrate dehydratase PrpD
MKDNPTQQLADFIVATRLEDLPGSSRERAKIVLIDTIASALMGIGDPEVARIEKLALSVAPTGNSPVVGGKPLGNGAAVLLNGYLINAATVCDVHAPTMCHTTPAAFPPSLAVSVERGASGADFLLAFALGLETAIRVGIGSNYPAFRANGWHSPGVWGPFGSAAATGKLLGLDPHRMRNALSLAGSQSGGTFACWGSPTVKFHQSRGSLSGYLAANLAEAGFESAVDILTAEDGGLYRACSDGGRPEATVDALGDRWEFESLTLSMYPFANALVAVALAILDLADKNNAGPGEIERVTMRLGWRAFGMHAPMLWEDPFHARLSAPYVAAVTVADRACGPDQFVPSRLADPDLAAFARERVTVVQDDSLGESGSAVELQLADGRVVEADGAVPPGTPDTPLSVADVRSKFLAAAARVHMDDWAENALSRLESIEEVDKVDGDLVGSLP